MKNILICITFIRCLAFIQAGSRQKKIGGKLNAPQEDENSFQVVKESFWCDNGDVSQITEELGLVLKTDRCCHDHNKCANAIGPDEYRFGLHNKGLFPRANCSCDDQFFNCLKKAGNPLSFETGNTYFNIMGSECYMYASPIDGCKLKRLGRCIEYKYDDNEDSVWQWFDNPTFL